MGLALSFILLLVSFAAVAAGRKPHLIMYVLDDMGWADAGYHGGNFPTPNMDSLSADGLRFERYYAQPECSPTRSSLMTGRYPFRTGLHMADTIAPGSTAGIPKDTPTIAELLKDQGYRTHAVGKWHLGYSSWTQTPLGRGFESYAGYLQGAIDYYNHTFGPNQGKVKGVGYDLWRNKTAAWEQAGVYSADFYQAEAKRVLDNHNANEPLFMYFAHQLIHEPDEQPTGTVHQQACAAAGVNGSAAGVNRFTTCTMTSRADADLAQLVQWIRNKGMWDDTLLWLVSDNGGMVSQGKQLSVASGSSNWPLRAGKGTLFEGGVRAPAFLVGGENVMPAAARGKEAHGLLHHVDVAKTLCAQGGCDTAALSADGNDVWQGLVESAAAPVTVRTELPVSIDTATARDLNEDVAGNWSALIQGDWKLIQGVYNMKQLAYDGWWSNDPQTVEQPNATSSSVPELNGCKDVLLFNITSDPGERHNVALQHPSIVRALQARIAWYAEPANGYMRQQGNIPHPRSLPPLHNGTWAPFLP